MFSTDISELLPGTQKKIKRLEEWCAQEGVFIRRTCTYRSPIAQKALYARGRESYADIIELYKEAGLTPPIDALEPNWWRKKVTWTLKSYHSTRRAVDYCMRGKTPYDLKIDVNRNEVPDWEEFAIIARKCGLNAGYFWKPPKRDCCHVQDDDIYANKEENNNVKI